MSCNYIYTASGGKYDFLDPDPKMLNIEDIAHQLALTNRWGGCTQQPFSVAQHSCLVAEMVQGGLKMKRTALMHDATEALVGDMPRPLKLISPEFQEFEAIAWQVIVERFDIYPDQKIAPVHEADTRILAWEALLLMPPNCHAEHFARVPDPPESMEELLKPWPWKLARSTFLSRWEEFHGK